MHPAPLVTHPYLCELQAAFVVKVVAAEPQVFNPHDDVVLITHPVSQVSLHVASDDAYSHDLSAHFVVSVVKNPQNIP